MITHRIYIMQEPLTDGSLVYGVGIFDAEADGLGVIFEAIDYRHANELAKTLRTAITVHSLSKVEIIDRTG